MQLSSQKQISKQLEMLVNVTNTGKSRIIAATLSSMRQYTQSNSNKVTYFYAEETKSMTSLSILSCVLLELSKLLSHMYTYMDLCVITVVMLKPSQSTTINLPFQLV